MEHDPLLFFNLFQLLDQIRQNITPTPHNVALILKDMKFILRINFNVGVNKLLGYDLELTFLDSLRIKDMNTVVDVCSESANKFIASHVK